MTGRTSTGGDGINERRYRAAKPLRSQCHTEDERLLDLRRPAYAEVGYVGSLRPIAQSPARRVLRSAWLYYMYRGVRV